MVRRSAAGAMEAGHQVTEGNALALVAAAAAGGGGPKEPAGLPCPRCESTYTKFCYYNNYSLGQPRHFCKGCRRYWTRGGALRNVPVGGGTRRGVPAARRKRATSASSSSSPASALPPPPLASSSPAPLAMSAPAACYAMARPYDLPPFMPPLASPVAAVGDPDCRLLDLGGSFTSLLAPAAPDVRFSAGFLVGGLPPVMMPPPPASSAPALLPPPVSQALPEGLIWGMGWPDLSI